MNIPDAPWIQAAERRGTGYMYNYLFGIPDDYEPEEEEEEEEDV